MTYTVAQLAEHYQVSQHTILGYIARGELKAVDVSRNRGGRPRWRISQRACDAWEATRTATPPVPRTTRRRKKQTDVIEFY